MLAGSGATSPPPPNPTFNFSHFLVLVLNEMVLVLVIEKSLLRDRFSSTNTSTKKGGGSSADWFRPRIQRER
ncbi:MAG: hypothetical protein ACKO3T_00690, partial [Planctomycetaceae bacterium]